MIKKKIPPIEWVFDSISYHDLSAANFRKSFLEN